MIGGQTPGTAVAFGRRGLVRGGWSILLFLVPGVMVGFHTGTARAQSGTVHNDRGGGLRMTVDTLWPDGLGYRPVRITVTPTAPVVADRTLVFELITTSTQWRVDEQTTVTQDIELPAGTGPVTTTLAVPHMAWQDDYEYRVGEGGREIPGLSGSSVFQNRALEEAIPRVLLVADGTFDSSNLGRAFATSYTEWRTPDDKYPLPTFKVMAAQDLHSRWVDYSALDMICISFGDLLVLKPDHPAVFRALLDWTAAGGNLLVFDMGVTRERRETLERLVQLPPDGPEDDTWRPPQGSLFKQRVEGLGTDVIGPYEEIPTDEYGSDMYGNRTSRRGRSERKDEKSETRKPAPQRPSTSAFASRPYEMGMLVAIASDAPFDEDAGFWAWLCNDLTSARVIWSQRHGLSLMNGNPEFFNFMIPGVGKAPLNAFRVLITLFVLAIGPVNYYVLRHLRRLHLLVVTVPVSAAGVTFALFAYAILTDGLETRVRVRSVTHINQQTGQTECWARLSYYAGLAPRDGLEFSEDVAVYPFEAEPRESDSGDRELLWYNGQRMTSGWLRSRTPTQYLTVRSRRSDMGIDVGPASNAMLPVVNRLGTEVELIVLRDEAGDLHWMESLTDGSQGETHPITAANALSELSAKLSECDMSIPSGLPRSAYVTQDYGLQTALANSLMEGIIRDMAATSSPLSGLQPGSYVAVVRFSPEVELGTSGAQPEASLHLVVGTW
jgi:hypothetical protein